MQMAVVLLYGAGSGALHAVTGPDHVLSLGPVALEHPRNSWRIGLLWGVGHALGTLLLAIPAALLAQLLQLQALADWGDRLAGLVLCASAAFSWWSLRHHRPHGEPSHGQRGSLLVGLLHGVSGAGSLVLVLPVIISGSLGRVAVFLAAFSVGSTLAMALLTWGIAHLAGALRARTVTRARYGLTFASFVLGALWLVL